MGCNDGELSIALVDDEEMAGLNRQYRRLDATTDVLAFPMLEGDFSEVVPSLLGDVVISVPTAYSMSLEHHRPLSCVLDLLLVHGILHLLGYDHESGAAEAEAMREKTLELLMAVGYTDKDFDWFLGQPLDQGAGA